MAFTQQNRDVEITTPLGDDVLLLKNLNITEELSRLFKINVELVSTDNIDFEKLMGQNVTIRLNLPSGERYFNGFVSSLSQVENEGVFACYKAIIHPWLWFLTRTTDCRIFQDMTVPEIVKEVCQDMEFTDIEENLNLTYRTWTYCVQDRETDFNFISRLLEQEGIYYYFTHTENKHTMVLADGPGSHVLVPNCETIPFRPDDDTVFDNGFLLLIKKYPA